MALTTYLDKPILSQGKKSGSLRSFLAQCMLFQASNGIYKMIGLLAWVNISIVAYMVYAMFQKFAIHY